VSGGSIAVLLGGPSAEHDVSLVSGRAIAAALAERGHSVEGWLIDLDGGWWRLPPSGMDRSLDRVAYDDPRGLGADGPQTAGQALQAISAQDPRPVVFIALHGPFGEDGTVQALCEAAGLTYTGAGVAASAIGMDKVLFKRLVGGIGVPIVPWMTVSAADLARDGAGALRRLVEFADAQPDRRLIVKPARLGSSVGISIVHRPADPADMCAALDQAFRHDDVALVEAYLAGVRELEVSVVGNDASDLEVYGPGEIFPGHEFYDYAAKYEEGVSRTTDHPELPDTMAGRARDLAARAFLAIGAQGFARVDFLAARDELLLSEINTIPGFTPISLFPVLCRQGGYDFGGISERIVELALARDLHKPQRRLTRADLP
jgi:D-alanine-D-alanine ligase